MRVGLVCPYSFGVPGGVQNHVADLAEALIARGHTVSVLAPADEDLVLPPYVVAAGRAVPVPYNGSVARLVFGPVSAARVRRWLRDGEFDVLHVHEPATPSLSLLALWAASGPVVATFHTAMERSRAMSAAAHLLRPQLEKLAARIAVSEQARATLVHHLGGEPVVIPNGVYVDRFATARARPEWRSPAGTVGFLGRLDEPRKGLAVLLAAAPALARARPGVSLLVAGRGDVAAARAGRPADGSARVRFLGQLDDTDRARLLASCDVFVAPNTHGESFGIVVVEAMAAGTAIVASDLAAFRHLLADGACGVLTPAGDAPALAAAVAGLLGAPDRRERLRAAAAAAARRYDWARVAAEIVAVYEMVVAGDPKGVRVGEGAP